MSHMDSLHQPCDSEHCTETTLDDDNIVAQLHNPSFHWAKSAKTADGSDQCQHLPDFLHVNKTSLTITMSNTKYQKFLFLVQTLQQWLQARRKLTKLPLSSNVNDLQCFVGMVNFLKKVLPNFG